MHRKLSIFFFAGFIALAGCLHGLAQTNSDRGDRVYTSRQITELWGWLAAQQQNLAGIDIRPAELGGFLEGFLVGFKNLPSPSQSPTAMHDVEKLAHDRRAGLIRSLTETNEARAKLFFAALSTNTDVFPLPDGAFYRTIKAGNHVTPHPSQTVTVYYTGHLLDGTEFVQMGPLDLVLVTNRSVCRGWFPVLQRMMEGGTIGLFVPPPLSEDEAARWGVPPGSALVFEIQLTGVKDTAPSDLENALLPAAPEPPEPSPSGCSEAELLKTWGWSVARSLRLDKVGFTAEELDLFTNGLALGISGRPAAVDPVKIYPLVEKMAAARRAKTRATIHQNQMARMEELFDRLKQDTNVVTLPDGLRYEILAPGHGLAPKPGQMVVVDYTARLINGTIFDQTYNEPLHIQIGSVISGLNEGLQQVNRGGKIRLYVPPSIGYGSQDHSGVVSAIPADSTLIYEITLLDLQDAPPDETPPAGQ